MTKLNRNYTGKSSSSYGLWFASWQLASISTVQPLSVAHEFHIDLIWDKQLGDSSADLTWRSDLQNPIKLLDCDSAQPGHFRSG